MFLNIIASDADGQFLPSFSLEVKTFHIHGFTEGGMLVDITHTDGEKERVFLEGESRPFAPMKLEQLAQINSITLYDGYPASEILSKAEYRAKVGCGALLTPAGHFMREKVQSKVLAHYEMIRAGAGYDPVIVVSPPGAGPETEGAVFYERRSWGDKPNQFKQIDARAALMAFSGHADGWGWADLPQQTFADLDAVEAWIKS